MDTLLNMLLGLSNDTGIIDELTNVFLSMDNILVNVQTQIIYIKETMNTLFYISIASIVVAVLSLICSIVLLVKINRLRGR